MDLENLTYIKGIENSGIILEFELLDRFRDWSKEL